MKRKRKTNYNAHGVSGGAVAEVHLRHLTVEEALPKMEDYIYNAYISGLTQVKVVHGKGGTGILRQEVSRALLKNSLVKSFRLGGYGEGGIGVTIVELSEK